MTTSMSCSWCHASNIIKPVGETYCVNCGHRADVCRLDCTCVRCQPFSPTAAATHTNAVELLDRLSVDEIRARLEELDRERGALMVLLRSALRRRPRDARPPKVVPRD